MEPLSLQPSTPLTIHPGTSNLLTLSDLQQHGQTEIQQWEFQLHWWIETCFPWLNQTIQLIQTQLNHLIKQWELFQHQIHQLQWEKEELLQVYSTLKGEYQKCLHLNQLLKLKLKRVQNSSHSTETKDILVLNELKTFLETEWKNQLIQSFDHVMVNQGVALDTKFQSWWNLMDERLPLPNSLPVPKSQKNLLESNSVGTQTDLENMDTIDASTPSWFQLHHLIQQNALDSSVHWSLNQWMDSLSFIYTTLQAILKIPLENARKSVTSEHIYMSNERVSRTMTN